MDQLDLAVIGSGGAATAAAIEARARGARAGLVEHPTYVLATGALPHVPDLPGIDAVEVRTSNPRVLAAGDGAGAQPRRPCLVVRDQAISSSPRTARA